MVSKAQHWDEIYRTKAVDELGWYKASDHLSIDILNNHNLGSDHSVIDIGAGTSLFVDELLDLGFHDIGLLEISAEALSITRERLATSASVPAYYIQDATQIRLSRHYDIWHDRAVFHFLTNAKDRQCYLEGMHKVLNQDGMAIIATFSPDGPAQCSGLDVERYDEDKMKKILAPLFSVEQVISNTHKTPSGIEQHYNFFIIKVNQV